MYYPKNYARKPLIVILLAKKNARNATVEKNRQALVDLGSQGIY
jgi:hypothetical protein